ncbi:MAG: D-alanine--D-alanine ligase [Candidatus Tagabacteria bacterium CG_4_9_14_0_2_um_filter_41_11]|uniref:D-alanine--D-alanine ligase n=1 Tax=Candidatus Tagabacteria bacterium CG_4_9_14_0_2_um_filter_41_11 TaxID=1975019 RepID=A0A2M8ERW8_9BACT|nr:MAG: D-alanine--D-alanine ligase [Candidatus Tagabacteria bacterium CG_4_9_14_0_2_um_filter_41_11]
MTNGEQKICLIVYDALQEESTPDDPNSDYTLAEKRTDIVAVKNALKEGGFGVKTMGLRRINAKVISRMEENNPDIIFNLCESLYGESRYEMYATGVFELLKIPYTGSSPFALGLALNKRKSKQILRAAGLPVPSSVLAISGQWFSLSDLESPYIIKPVREDASTGISSKSVAKTKEEVEERVKFIHENYQQPALIEEFIPGREINISITGSEEPRVLAIGEIDFSKMPKGEPNIVSYQAKWNPESPLFGGTEPVYPAKLEEELKAKIEKAAIKAYLEIGCRDYGRIDMRLREDGKFYILEVNTNPDISPDSGFNRAAQAAGMSYSQWICEIASSALKRTSRKTKELFAKSVI